MNPDFSSAANSAEMVTNQLETRGITDSRVLNAMIRVPRHEFIPEKYSSLGYSDQPVPIGFQQTISQPYVVAFMTQNLELTDQSKVLEIGTGSGYQAAVLSRIVRRVFSVEVIPELAERATAVFTKLNYTNIHVKTGNGRDGWPDQAPFSHIIVTAASEYVPQALLNQLHPDGRMIIPLGKNEWNQHLCLVRKFGKKVSQQKLLPVRFVPLVGSRNEEREIRHERKKNQ